MKPAISLLSLALGLNTVSHAAVIAVANGNFTTNAGATATNWTDLQPSGGGTVYYNPAEAAAPDHVAYLQGSGTSSPPHFVGIVQNLSSFNSGLTVTTLNNYTITFDAGFRNDAFSGTVNMTIRLVDMGADNVYQTADTVLALKNFTRTSITTGNPLLGMTQEIANLSFTSSSTNNIALVFENTTTGNNSPAGNGTFRQTGMIDNISITAIPEPSSALLGGLGMLCLLRRRRH